MDSHNIEVVRNFIYLGSEVTSDNNTSVEMKRRIVLAYRRLYSLNRLLRSKQLSRKTMVRLYLVLPVLLYGSESWSLTAADEQLLATFERKILRIIFGAFVSMEIEEYYIIHGLSILRMDLYTYVSYV